VAVEQAVVRWIKAYQSGVSFLDMPPDTHARLALVFQVLLEAQQPDVHRISGSACLGSGTGQKAVGSAEVLSSTALPSVPLTTHVRLFPSSALCA
jgi:hypothetical protein